MAEKMSSRSKRVRVPNERNRRRRQRERNALNRPWVPMQRHYDLRVRYAGLAFPTNHEGTGWTQIHTLPEWGIGTQVSLLMPPEPHRYNDDGWEFIQYLWQIPSELGMPTHFLTNPVSDAQVRFDGFPTHPFHAGREVVFVDLLEAHRKTSDGVFLPITIRGSIAGMFQVHVEERSDDEILVSYLVKSPVATNK